jgi:hypothetical protein
MKQTSIEWLIEELEGSFSIIARAVGVKKYNEIVKNAIEMHKAEMGNKFITDEEIEKEAHKISNDIDKHISFVEGAKWYREKLKCKGNGES